MGFKNLKQALNIFGKKLSDENLIVFDWRSIIFISFILFCFVFAVIFKLHTSSLPYWDNILRGNTSKQGLLVGTPRGIRSDEWLVSTPFLISQQLKNFPLDNLNIGAAHDPILLNLPVRNLVSYLRPQHWGPLLLGPERGFAYFWDFRILGIILGSFLVLMLVTKSNFWLSVFGSFWIFFSSFTQWWFSSIDPALWASLIFASFVYLVLSKSKAVIIISGITLAISCYNFALVLYPAFQIPLVYLYIFLAIGYFANGFKEKMATLRSNWQLRLGVAIASIGMLGASIYFFWHQAIQTIKAVTNTVYPGRRISVGGEYGFQLFSGYFTNIFRGKTLPAALGNMSEASNYILMFPVVIAAEIYLWIKKKKLNPMLTSLTIYLLIMVLWTFFKWPVQVANLTLLGMVPAKRALIGIGLGSIFLTLIFLSEPENKVPRSLSVVLTALFAFFIAIYGKYFLGFVGYNLQIKWLLVLAGVSLVTIVAAYAICRGQKLLFAAMISILLLPNVGINPISYGYDPINNSQFAQFVNQNPELKRGEWVVYGGNIYPNYLKALGLNVINGVNYTPNEERLKNLDPNGKFSDITNRYAHIGYEYTNLGKFDIVLNQADYYTVKINPCDNRLENLNIKYIASDKELSTVVDSCLSPMSTGSISGLWVYSTKGN